MVNGFLGQNFLGPDFLAPETLDELRARIAQPGGFAPQVPQQQQAPQQQGFLGTLGQAFRGENDLFNTGLGIATASGGFGEAIQQGILGAQNMRRQREQNVLDRQEQEVRIAELGRRGDLATRAANLATSRESRLAGQTDVRNFIRPDGTPFSAFVGSPEEADAVRRGFPEVGLDVQATTPGAFGGTESQRGKLQIDINEQTAAINTFGSSAQQLLDIVGEGGANTLTAGLANIGNRLRQEVRTLASRTGIEFESGQAAFDQNNFQGAFDAAGLAGESARVKNAFLALAIQRAIASGLGTGRALSDKDIENQLRTLGQNQSDPEILRQIFSDDFGRLSEGVRFRGQASGLNVPELVPPQFINRERIIIDLR